MPIYTSVCMLCLSDSVELLYAHFEKNCFHPASILLAKFVQQVMNGIMDAPFCRA